nr:immunoglobulin light chain junction region [Macaca mulatta]MOW34364.1 immunoglobulin light chain junction region [Macaca mulatta]MOW34793.1 immunoglobulin light chain junction region [Macaca mulatta]MOW35004.1 immunoglobulin light chain junction region [Macaca mulatta]MOW35144.1 immunoglobulin light chain junction region [Macaca mulatta]
CQGYSNSLLTF